MTSLDRHILNQTTVVEVDQRRDRDVLLLDVLVVQDRLNGLLDLGRGDTLVVFCRALGHVQIQLQDVVELVARVQVAQTLGDSRVLRRGSLHAYGRLGTLGARLDVLEVGGVLDCPIAQIFVPLGNFFVLAELLGRDQILDDHVLQFELVSELVDGVVHIVPLAIKVLIDTLKFAISTLKLLPELVQLVRLEVELFLEVGEILLHLVRFLFLLLQFHLQLSLLLLLFGQLLSGLLELLLLGLGHLHDLAAYKHLLLHLCQLLDQLLLLGLRLLLRLFLLLKLFKQFLLFLFFQMCLVLNI